MRSVLKGPLLSAGEGDQERPSCHVRHARFLRTGYCHWQGVHLLLDSYN